MVMGGEGEGLTNVSIGLFVCTHEEDEEVRLTHSSNLESMIWLIFSSMSGLPGGSCWRCK